MKHSYQTRRLLALREMRHDGQAVVIGGEVFATETDANYLIRSGAAADPNEVQKKLEQSATQQRRKAGRLSNAERAARAQSTGTDKPPEGSVSAGDGELGAEGSSGLDGASESGDQAAG